MEGGEGVVGVFVGQIGERRAGRRYAKKAENFGLYPENIFPNLLLNSL